MVRALLPYAERQCAQGVPVKAITRHILGLFNGLSGARLWRRSLSEEAHQPGAGPEVIERALDMVVSRRAPSGSARLPMDAARHTTLVPPILSNR